jgi:hypothetical protein
MRKLHSYQHLWPFKTSQNLSNNLIRKVHLFRSNVKIFLSIVAKSPNLYTTPGETIDAPVSETP